ncbi:MAG: hypothetical protein E7660_05155 [Ruminococcaceae bacterium]|nr:hypothetical protein [Oscillospiraceae bacterium]
MRRFLSIILALLMVIGMVPVAVSAEAGVTDDGFSYTSNGTNVYITGYEGKETELVFPSEIGGVPVVYISQKAFYGNTDITKVILPEGVKNIMATAFYGCSSIAEMHLPESISIVGNEAFRGCTGLKRVYYAGSEEQWNKVIIADGNDHLLQATIDFAGGELPDYEPVPEGLGYWVGEDGVTIQSYRGTANELVIPSTIEGKPVVEIQGYAFRECNSLTSVTVPETVKLIGTSAFHDCENIIYVHLSEGLETIELYAFSGCRSLVSIDIPSTVTKLGAIAFGGCESLTRVNIKGSIKKLEGATFENCVSLTDITLPEGLEEIANDFTGCASLGSITLPDSLKAIGYSVFSGCTSLSSINIPEGITKIPDGAFMGCSSLQYIELPSGVTQFGYDCFAGSGLASITLPLGTTVVPQRMFKDCESLAFVSLPDSITTIESWAFENCTSLASIKLPVRVKSIDSNAFNGSGLSSISYYNTLGCFLPDDYECQYFNSITYYGSREDWIDSEDLLASRGISLNCTGSYNYVEREFPEGLEFRVENREVVLTGYSGDKTSIVIPDTIYGFPVTVVEGLGGYRSQLTSITLPDSVREIGDSALLLTNLEYVNIPSSLKRIGDEAFRDTDIKSLILPEGLEAIGAAAFNGMSYLEELSIPSTATEIGGGITTGCASLTSITVAEGNSRYHSSGNCVIETAEQTVIAGCAVSSIPADGSVRTIADNAFYCVGTIDELYIPISVSTIWSRAFWDTPVTKVIYQGSEAQWAALNYTNVGGLAGAKVVFMNETVEADPLDNLSYTIENGEVTITGYSGIISDYVIPSEIEGCPVTVIGSRAFQNNTLLTSIVIPEGVTTIETYAFSGCASLTKIRLPETLTAVKSRAFGNAGLVTVEYAGTEDEWGDVGIASGNNPLKNAEFVFNAQPEADILSGDVNGDGEIDAKDMLLLKKYIAEVTDNINVDNSDMNGDDEINAKDMMLLKKYIKGL